MSGRRKTLPLPDLEFVSADELRRRLAAHADTTGLIPLAAPPMRDYFFALDDHAPAGGFRVPHSGIVRASDEADARERLDGFLRQHGYPQRGVQYRIVDPSTLPDVHHGVVALAMASR